MCSVWKVDRVLFGPTHTHTHGKHTPSNKRRKKIKTQPYNTRFSVAAHVQITFVAFLFILIDRFIRVRVVPHVVAVVVVCVCACRFYPFNGLIIIGKHPLHGQHSSDLRWARQFRQNDNNNEKYIGFVRFRFLLLISLSNAESSAVKPINSYIMPVACAENSAKFNLIFASKKKKRKQKELEQQRNAP